MANDTHKGHEHAPSPRPVPQDPRSEIGRNIRQYREALDLDQASLADLAKLGNKQTVSAIERGERDVKAFELSRIARALHVTMDAVLGLTSPVPVPQVLWRRREVSTLPSEPESRKWFLRRDAQLRERAQRYAMLEEWCAADRSESLPVFNLDIREITYQRAAEMAERVRGSLDLGGIPAASLEDTLATRFGVKIFYDALGLGGEASAACVRDDETFGCAVLLNSDDAPTRRAFSLAHELFHLVTWPSVADALEGDGITPGVKAPAWYVRMEKCAQSFAAALLIPADGVNAALEQRARQRAGERPVRPADHLEPSDYAFIAHGLFRVSTDALLWRLVTLNHLSRDEREAVVGHPELSAWGMPAMARRGVFPDRFWELIRLAHQRGEAGLGKLAEFAEMSPTQLNEFLSVTEQDPDYEASIRASSETALV